MEVYVEVYADDMLVKSLDEGKHLDDMQETFDTLRQHNMKLNPSKCAFGVSWFHIKELKNILIKYKRYWI